MDGLDRYSPLETALKGAGFMVDEVEKQGKKTVITVFRYVKNEQKAASKTMTCQGNQSLIDRF